MNFQDLFECVASDLHTLQVLGRCSHKPPAAELWALPRGLPGYDRPENDVRLKVGSDDLPERSIQVHPQVPVTTAWQGWSLQLYDVVGPSSLSDKVDRLPCWWSALPGCFHPSDLQDLCQLLQDFVGQVVAPPVPTLGQCWLAERQRCASTCWPNLWSCCSITPRSSSILAGLGSGLWSERAPSLSSPPWRSLALFSSSVWLWTRPSERSQTPQG